MLDKYLRQYAEPEARLALEDPLERSYQEVLIVPAYAEDPELLHRLQHIAAWQPNLLIILVLNRPDDERDDTINDALRDACLASHHLGEYRYGALLEMRNGGALLLVERADAMPEAEGVGLARKIGCDIALALQCRGCVNSHWLHNTDADARLPESYFVAAQRHSGAVAIAHAFKHDSTPDSALDRATYLYDLRLRYYVMGLQKAGSPYALHTLGSCISVDAKRYAQVRGFPRRAGGEDFYLINKLAKLGTVASPASPVITLTPRVSDRVPFGTGPAVSRLLDSRAPYSEPLFYHPECFTQLATVLNHVTAVAEGERRSLSHLDESSVSTLNAMGIEQAFRHCDKQSADAESWIKHFHQWFDGFRTLKFVHGIRESGYPDLNLADSRKHPKSIWPSNWAFRD